MQVKTIATLALIGAGAVVAFMAYRKASAAASAVGQAVTDTAWAVTPWNNDNVIYGGVNSAGSAITGDSNFTLGGWIYDVTHPEPKPYTSGGGGQFTGTGASGGW